MPICKSLSSITAPLETTDLYFLGLRLLSIIGGALWLLAIPYPPPGKSFLTVVFITYISYSVLLYLFILARPTVIKRLYLLASVIDLSLIGLLLLSVAELRGSFYLALYVLVALHSYYFGVWPGLGLAILAASLYTSSIFLSRYSPLPWPDLIMRLTFLFLLSVSLGLLARKDREDKAKILRLSSDLAQRNSILEQVYRYLSIGKMAGGIAQSLNNPAGIISGRAGILLEEAKAQKLPPSFVQGLEVIVKHAYRIAEVTRNLLLLSRPSSSELQPVNVNEAIEGTLLFLEGQFTQRKITVIRKLLPNLPPLRVNREGLEEVLVNLLMNAVDALPGGGTITVETTRKNEEARPVLLRISDTGVGIREEHLDRIFAPFFTTKDNDGGIGLGLSLCLEIVKSFDGLISVESRAGQGTSFTLSFPAYHEKLAGRAL